MFDYNRFTYFIVPDVREKDTVWNNNTAHSRYALGLRTARRFSEGRAFISRAFASAMLT